MHALGTSALVGLALLLAAAYVVRAGRRRTTRAPRTYGVTPLDAGLAIALVACLAAASTALLGTALGSV